MRSFAPLREGVYVFVIEDVEDTSCPAVGRPVAEIPDIDIVRRLSQGNAIAAAMQHPRILLLFLHRACSRSLCVGIVSRIHPGVSLVGPCEVLFRLVCFSANLPDVTVGGYK